MGALELWTSMVCDLSRELVVVQDTWRARSRAHDADDDVELPLDELLIEPSRLEGVSTVVLHEAHLMSTPRWGGSWADLCWLAGVLPGFYVADATRHDRASATTGCFSDAHTIEAMANVGGVVAMVGARAVTSAPDQGARWIAEVQRFGMIVALDLRSTEVTAGQLAAAAQAWAAAGIDVDCCVAVRSDPGRLRPERVGGHQPAPDQFASPG